VFDGKSTTGVYPGAVLRKSSARSSNR